jgi:SEC-C motif-containing protein
MNLTEYLERTWHGSTRPKSIHPDGNESTRPRWMGLRVKRHEVIDADREVVEFTVRYKLNGRVFTMHEVSRFVRENGNWLYLDGTHPRRQG